MSVLKNNSQEQEVRERSHLKNTLHRGDGSSDGGCPPLEQLWPVAVDELPSDSVSRHLESCGVCRERTILLAREINEARSLVADKRPSVGTFTDFPASGVGADVRVVSGARLADGPVISTGDSDCEGIGDADAPVLPEKEPEPADPGETTAQRQAVIGKYLVLETICQSGQATVYRGLHPSLLIDVVIKLANRPWRCDDTGRAQLVSEAKALAEIVHPHLARLYDLDFYDDRPFLVLEYVRGGHLAQYRESTDMNPCQIASLVEKVARAVAVAHEHGILHLDLKPENILVTPAGEPVLIDFGLSFLSASGGVRSPQGACVAGTPQYMSPEQTQGDRESLTQRTDVYGLGGVLYFLCVGKDPFEVTNVDGRLRRPEQPDWHALACADVPSRLKAICRKALSTNPEARYTTAERFADALKSAGCTGTAPVLGRLRKLAGVMFFSGVACLTAAALVPSHASPRPSTLRLRVIRAGQEMPLPEAIPLQARDRIRLEGFVRESSYTAILSVNEAGAFQWIGPLQVTQDHEGARVSYPGFSKSIPVSPNAGAMLVLLLSHRDRPVRPRDTAGMIPQTLSLSSFPQQAIVLFDRQQCDILVRFGASLTSDQRKSVRSQVRLLQHQLAGRFDDFAGILAVPTDTFQACGLANDESCL